MTHDQAILLAVLVATVALFLWGRWRHDVVALLALLACVAAGLVPAPEAFAGFGHPAVVTVACVLVMSHGLRASGAVDALTRRLMPSTAGSLLGVAALTGLGAALSAFMNNVGALALLMPVAVHLARKHDLPPGRVLMPLAFGTILGGMTTLIGTPPNLIVAGFRAETGAAGFGMFDFTPVGAAVALAGLAFIGTVGWRLVPVRRGAVEEAFDTGRYLTEVHVDADSRVVGMRLDEIDGEIDEDDAQVVGLVRQDTRLTPPNPGRVVREGDVLVLEAEPEALGSVLSTLGLRLEEAEEADHGGEDGGEDGGEGAGENAHEEGDGENDGAEDTGDEGAEEGDGDERDVALQEFVVMPQALLIGRSATDLQLRTRRGINLLAISRQGQRSIRRLRAARLRGGDVILLQGTRQALAGFALEFGVAPLAERDIVVPDTRRAWLAGIGMLLAVAVAALGLAPAAIAFAAGVVAFMLLRVVPPRDVYRAIDWPVVVLLAALLPVAGAMATTGTADLLAVLLLEGVAQGRPVVTVALLLVVTMTLSDFMNNAATAAVMCPIAIGAAAQLGANPDTFLMAVAVGGSCAFLTPIGHQNNTLILGPGGFRFGDYWRLGLPLELIVVAVGVPMLLWVWPL
ncbi:MAG: SLC13 family permease [Trueperaceae bacterium]|nr:SLC13 family permease [Trueperaceae bacterium]